MVVEHFDQVVAMYNNCYHASRLAVECRPNELHAVALRRDLRVRNERRFKQFGTMFRTPEFSVK
jgi:hypothetical protein